jgi:hypothetical protein
VDERAGLLRDPGLRWRGQKPLHLSHVVLHHFDRPGARFHPQHPLPPPMPPSSAFLTPTFSSTPFFYDRSGSLGGANVESGAEMEGEAWRGGQVGGTGVGVSQPVFLLVLCSKGGVSGFWRKRRELIRKSRASYAYSPSCALVSIPRYISWGRARVARTERGLPTAQVLCCSP